jgi:hypothetical protein
MKISQSSQISNWKYQPYYLSMQHIPPWKIGQTQLDKEILS